MTKAIPQIQKFMSTTPHTIDTDMDLLHAKMYMQEHKIRHLPVMDDGHVVGILSEKDIDYLQGFRGVDLKMETLNLFDYLQRNTSAENSEKIGWGIGLTLVKGMALAHGGVTDLRSKKYEGTTFTVKLPKKFMLTYCQIS